MWRSLVPYGLIAAVAGILALVLYLALPRDRAIELAHPLALALLAGCALAAWVAFHLHIRRSATFSFSRVGELGRVRPGPLAWLAAAPRALRITALGLLAVALARPQTFTRQVTQVDGIDIMIVLDLSKSMEERDLDRRRNRLVVAQQTIRNFLKGRKNDRIGIVVFAKQALLQCPLTLDYGALDTIVADLRIGDVDAMGTAIGDGLGLGLASLRRSDAKSKVAILLTDGDSNVINVMSPEEARDKAKEQGVRVFTVLMGQEQQRSEPQLDGTAPFWGRRPYAVNPKLLQDIAQATRGRYFNAATAAQLDKGFEAVRATLDKSKRKEVRKIPSELYAWFAFPALGLLLVEIALALTRWRRFP